MVEVRKFYHTQATANKVASGASRILAVPDCSPAHSTLERRRAASLASCPAAVRPIHPPANSASRFKSSPAFAANGKKPGKRATRPGRSKLGRGNNSRRVGDRQRGKGRCIRNDCRAAALETPTAHSRTTVVNQLPVVSRRFNLDRDYRHLTELDSVLSFSISAREAFFSQQ